MVLSTEQEHAYEILCGNRNVFLTGRAGTGKSVLLKKFIEEHKGHTVVCAPTGVAAQNIGGTTLHRAFDIPSEPCPKPGRKHVKLLEGVDTVIIDEISMCRIDVFAYAVGIIRNMEKMGVFIRLIVCGDFFQLPPVVRADEIPIFKAKYGKYRKGVCISVKDVGSL